MCDDTPWCYTLFAVALIIVTKYQVIATRRAIENKVKHPEMLSYILVQLLVKRLYSFVRYHDDGHKSDGNMLVKNNRCSYNKTNEIH
jgi:hypothetical protein